MAELVEYSLVVMTSTLFVTGSVLVYRNYSSLQAGLSLHAEFDAVSTLASNAIGNGSARGTMSLPGSVISCQGGVLSVVAGGSSLNQTVPSGCGFTVGISAGVHTLEFTYDHSLLDLSVA